MWIMLKPGHEQDMNPKESAIGVVVKAKPVRL